MTVWFTADLHLGHANIINYCHRPFRDVDHMNAELIGRWNEVVQDDDVVWVLGDFAMGKIDETLPLAAKLRGTKHLVAGNHDRCWGGHGIRAQEWVGRYKAAGFTSVHYAVLGAGSGWLMNHFPYAPGHDPRYEHHLPVDRGDWLLHGHVHDTWVMKGKQINVGVDVWDYYPVNGDHIARLIGEYPNGITAGATPRIGVIG